MEAILKKEIITNKIACRVLAILTFVILTSLGAFVRIPLPFSPVPITLQTFFVLLSAAVLPRGLGAITQLSYISLGVIGLPIFAGTGSGLFYLLGPTGGYLFGFVVCALFVAKTIKYGQDNLFFILFILCVADFIILSSGVIWLKYLLGYPLVKLLSIGFMPFVPGDLLKALVAAVIYLRIKNRAREIFW